MNFCFQAFITSPSFLVRVYTFVVGLSGAAFVANFAGF